MLQKNGRYKKMDKNSIYGTKERKTFTLVPGTYKDVAKIAFVKRLSVSGIVQDFFLDYIERNKESLEAYERIKKSI